MSNMISPIENDPFPIIAQAFTELYPGYNCNVYFHDNLQDENGLLDGLTTYPSRPSELTRIELWAGLSIKTQGDRPGADEIFCHELAHLVTEGDYTDHGDNWRAAFERIYGRYRELDRMMEGGYSG